MAGKKKKFAAPVPVQVKTSGTTQSSPDVHLPQNPSSTRLLNLSDYLRRGCDDWVWAVSGQLHALLDGKTAAPATVAAFYRNGWRHFFQFLNSNPCALETFSRSEMRGYAEWLKEHNHLRASTKKAAFFHMKSIIVGMIERKLINGGPDFFPRNPFPGTNGSARSETPLSEGERSQLVAALKKDIVALHHGEFTGTHRQALVVYALAIGLRTGLNKAPLVELKRAAVAEHPWLPRMGVLRSEKRRGHNSHLAVLRSSHHVETDTVVPLDGVAVLRKALESTEKIASEAPPHLKEFLWIYRSERPRDHGRIRRMSDNAYSEGLMSFVERHGLVGEGGSPLRLNSQRLRKTMENRLWMLSNGDLLAVASAMGHTPRVAGVHYLSVTPELQQKAAIVGEALPAIFSGRALEEKRRTYQPTPLGGCMDPVHGDKAPKNGSEACSNFMSCFECRSFAVVGADEDLHRLYSFYWYLDREKDRVTVPEWAERYALIMQAIDDFTKSNFDGELVGRAKRRAQKTPHVFWRQLPRAEER